MLNLAVITFFRINGAADASGEGLLANRERYYKVLLPRLLNRFDGEVKLLRPVLERYFDPERIDDLIALTRLEYSAIIPTLPYLGGKQPFTRFIIATGELLAVYRVASAWGKTLEEIGQLTFDIDQAYMQAFPALIKKTMSRMNFSKWYLMRLQKRAVDSHRRLYSDGYVFDFIPGDGNTFDYGVDYLECASCKFLKQEGAFEFARFICPADVLYSQSLGWGLMRTRTLAEGADRCDFRFKRGGKTLVAVPSCLQDRIPSTN